MGHRRDDLDFDERQAYAMCKRKIKLKSSEASKKAGRYKQRKYRCPICGGWHLTKQREFNEAPSKKQQRRLFKKAKEGITNDDG